MKAGDSQRFESLVAGTVERYGMDLSRPLALVSGGPDSTSLLRVMVGLGASPLVLHVDHGLRGEESRRDAEFVLGLSKELGLECEVRELALDDGPGLQRRAREMRYELAGELAHEIGASAVVTGHTADDVAETVLMNLSRGAGMRGLSGIPPVLGSVARPLIERRRSEVLRYLESLNQTYCVDPTNVLPKYTRNRVRHEVLPVLENLYPGAGANVARAAGLLREDLEALEEMAARAVQRRGNEILIPPEAELHAALRRHAVRYAYSTLASASPPLDSAAVESVLGLRAGSLDLPSGVCAAARAGGKVALYERRERRGQPIPETLDVIEGELRLSGWSVRVRGVADPEVPPPDAAQPEVAYLDADSGPYWLRLAREGDEVRPLGLGGGKKVFRAMMDRKVPKDLRPLTPVVVDGRERVAWVAFGEIGEEFALRDGVRRAIRLEASRLRENR